MWKGLLAPTFSSSETAAATAVLTLRQKKEEGIAPKRERQTFATDLFMDSPELLCERKPTEVIQPVEKDVCIRKTKYLSWLREEACEESLHLFILSALCVSPLIVMCALGKDRPPEGNIFARI